MDYNDSTKHILYFATVQPEMDKAFYAEADEQLKQIYLDYTAKRLSLINAGNTAAPEDIYDFDKKLSEKRLSPEEYYDVEKVNNLYFFEQIAKMFPDIDMESVLASSGLKKENKILINILINDVACSEEYAHLFTNENLNVLKTKAKLEVVNDLGDLLSSGLTEADNRFNQDYKGIEGAYTDKELAIISL